MGLKSGSAGDPFDEDEDDQEEESVDDVDEPTETTTPTNTTMSTNEIPYKFRRENVNEDRDQVPFFLREHVRDGERELVATVEDELDEDVPVSDVREAAMLVAQANPELVAAELRTWGYDLEE